MLNKGFTMSETLIILIILSLFSRLYIAGSFQPISKEQIRVYSLSNDLINAQMMSIKDKSANCLNDKDIIKKFPICFNQYGNINISQNISTLKDNIYITLYLGAGTHEIKKR